VPGRKELGDALLRNPSLSGQLREWIETTAALFAEAESSESSQASIRLQSVEEDGNSSPEERPQEKVTLLQRIRRLSAFQKVKAALLGSQEERMILVRDPNRFVARAV